MRVLRVGISKRSASTGGQRRYFEVMEGLGMTIDDSLMSPWSAIRALLCDRDAVFIAFDERYLVYCTFQLLFNRKVVFFPRGNKLVHHKAAHSAARLNLYRILFSWLYRKCKLLVFQTTAQAMEFQSMYGYVGEHEILPNNINASWMQPLIEYSKRYGNKFSVEFDKTLSVGFLGGTHPRKGF